MRLLTLCLLLLIACGKDRESSKSTSRPQIPQPSRPPIEPEPEVRPDPRVDPEPEVSTDPRVNQEDLKQIADILPTMYYIADEAKANCKGKYGSVTYTGEERTKIRTMDNRDIATVCTRFYRILLMEGSAILNDRGHGRFSVNYSGRVGEEKRFHIVDRCIFGEGVRRNLCLLPYHTLATDNSVHQIGDILFVPKAIGLLLPDGTKHEGYFIVRDTGGAFQGIGAQRVDMFTGLDPDYSNIFQKAGFHHKNPINAYKVYGPSANVVKDKLREKFGDLY